MTYHESQLLQLADSDYFKSVKFWDGAGNSTKTMDLNQDSIPVFLVYLQLELDRLNKLTKETGK